MRRHQLTDQDVTAAVEAVLEQAAIDGRAATVSALASRLQVNRQTIYRDFPLHASGLLERDKARCGHQPVGTVRLSGLDDRQTIARLRREKEDLLRHVRIYEDHIRRLTLENADLAEHLGNSGNVIRLDHHRRPAHSPSNPPEGAS